MLRSDISENKASRGCRDDAGQVQVIGDKVSSIGDDGGQRDFDFGVVECPGDGTGAIAEAEPRATPPPTASNSPASLPRSKCPPITAASKTWNKAAAVPSFSKLSPSINTESRFAHAEIAENGEHGVRDSQALGEYGDGGRA